MNDIMNEPTTTLQALQPPPAFSFAMAILRKCPYAWMDSVRIYRQLRNMLTPIFHVWVMGPK